MPKNVIHQLSGNFALDIKKSYTGGAVDAYTPLVNDKFYCYDVNSLYPSVMRNYDMPVGAPSHFIGDILQFKPDAFGFFDCIVTCPEDLVNPIIQIHHKTNQGKRTIAGTGTFKAMLFSEEIKNALKYGYKFEILSGYTFEKANVFKTFVDSLYQLRVKYPKSNPLNLVAKLLMNSLYGRFGMLDSFDDIFIFSKEQYDEFIKDNSDNIKDFMELGDFMLVFSKDPSEDLITLFNSLYESHNINVAIASAITAYARIEMSYFKNNPDFTLHYSDTDSAYISSKLPDELVSSTTLGKLKLEHTCTKGIFLAPKVYCIVTEEGKFISKVKGLSSKVNLTINDFEELLLENKNMQFSQTKWFKSLDKGSISIKNDLDTLKATSTKRNLVYENGKLVGTSSINFNIKPRISILDLK